MGNLSAILDNIYSVFPNTSNWNVWEEDKMLQITFYLPRLPSILGCSEIKSQRLTSFFFFLS